MDREKMDNLAPYMPLMPFSKLHLYGKAQAVLKRKMGHINVLGETDKVLQIVREARIWEEDSCIK